MLLDQSYTVHTYLTWVTHEFRALVYTSPSLIRCAFQPTNQRLIYATFILVHGQSRVSSSSLSTSTIATCSPPFSHGKNFRRPSDYFSLPSEFAMRPCSVRVCPKGSAVPNSLPVCFVVSYPGCVRDCCRDHDRSLRPQKIL